MTKSAAASPDAPPAAAGPAETTPAAETTPTPETTPAAESTPAEETTPAAESLPVAAPAPAPAKDGVTAKSSDLTAGPGGVMTDEVGVITGDLTLRSELDGTKLTLRVQYKEADEWYVVTGGKASLKDPEDLDAVHKIVVGILNRPEG